MNYVKQVAEILGVEIGEEFKIEEFRDSPKYRFVEDGNTMIQRYGTCNKEWFNSTALLLDLISGKYSIKKLPWKPKNDEDYWFYSYTDEYAHKGCWGGSIIDFMFLKVGNCFKTKEEAETKGKELVEQIKKGV